MLLLFGFFCFFHFFFVKTQTQKHDKVTHRFYIIISTSLSELMIKNIHALSHSCESLTCNLGEEDGAVLHVLIIEIRSNVVIAGNEMRNRCTKVNRKITWLTCALMRCSCQLSVKHKLTSNEYKQTSNRIQRLSNRWQLEFCCTA